MSDTSPEPGFDDTPPSPDDGGIAVPETATGSSETGSAPQREVTFTYDGAYISALPSRSYDSTVAAPTESGDADSNYGSVGLAIGQTITEYRQTISEEAERDRSDGAFGYDRVVGGGAMSGEQSTTSQPQPAAPSSDQRSQAGRPPKSYKYNPTVAEIVRQGDPLSAEIIAAHQRQYSWITVAGGGVVGSGSDAAKFILAQAPQVPQFPFTRPPPPPGSIPLEPIPLPEGQALEELAKQGTRAAARAAEEALKRAAGRTPGTAKLLGELLTLLAENPMFVFMGAMLWSSPTGPTAEMENRWFIVNEIIPRIIRDPLDGWVPMIEPPTRQPRIDDPRQPQPPWAPPPAPTVPLLDPEAPGGPSQLYTGDPRHHIFPQAFRWWFERKGIEIDDYTVELGEAWHEAVHKAGYNLEWQFVIYLDLVMGGPGGKGVLNRGDVIRFGQEMARRYGLVGAVIEYRRSKKEEVSPLDMPTVGPRPPK